MIENNFELNIDTERPEELVGKDLIFEDPDRDRSSVMTIKKIEPLGTGMTSSWVVKAVVEDKNMPGKELSVGLKNIHQQILLLIILLIPMLILEN